jgi:hypothetical protein
MGSGLIEKLVVEIAKAITPANANQAVAIAI